MTIKEAILAYLAGELNEIPATNTEEERLLAKAAQKIKAGLLPTPAAPVSPASSADTGKVPTVKADGTYELAAIPTEIPDPTDVTDGFLLTADGGKAVWGSPPEPASAE